jgi:protein TonB
VATQNIQDRFSAQRHTPAFRRAWTLALVVAIHAAILWLLLHIAPAVMSPPPGPETALVVDMLPADRVAPAARPQQRAARKTAAGSAATPQPETAIAPPPPDIPLPPPKPTTPSNDIWSQVIPMSGREFARNAVTPGTRAATPGTGTGEGGSDSGEGDAAADAGGGSGGGDRLYAADWYRRPTHTELATYLPRRAQSGWGEVACRTIPNNQVTDCREIGQSARGSGLAGAVRQAAWQFRILPPRVGGKPLIGSWVRIRITYTDEKGAAVE